MLMTKAEEFARKLDKTDLKKLDKTDLKTSNGWLENWITFMRVFGK